MSDIGKFIKLDDGTISGTVQTLLLNFEVEFRPIEAANEKAPDFRAYSQGMEIGAAWMRQAKESGNPYLSVDLDDPGLAQPIRARLTKDQAGDAYTLWWERDSGKKAKPQPTKQTVNF